MATCFSCGTPGLRSFYEVRSIPVHSCLMMASREEALAYPRRDLALGFCPGCGFVQNLVFDPSVHEYSTRYEETQGFSPRFNRFQDELIEKLLTDYHLHGKSVLEIGCGKGEFLVRMCELGGGSGIGIDPGYRAERTTSPAAGRLRFINDFYSPRYADLQADVVCCRHTLEHIQDTRAFVRLVRDTIGERRDTVVFFEVPDVYRVLEEQAFWDIYYEHCSYFSLGSLARLFRACDFDLLDLWTDFDDQYLMLTAVPASGGGRRFASEDDLPRLVRAVTTFADELPRKLAGRKTELAAVTGSHRRAVIWGSGSKAVSYLTTLDVGDSIEYVVDINPHKHGKFLAGTGHEIVGPDFLRGYRPDIILVMNPIYVEEIRRDCEAMGLHPELVAV